MGYRPRPYGWESQPESLARTPLGPTSDLHTSDESAGTSKKAIMPGSLHSPVFEKETLKNTFWRGENQLLNSGYHHGYNPKVFSP